MRICLVLFLAACAASAQPYRPADMVLRNGAVYTVDAVRRWADAIAITEKKIVYVGPNAGAAKYIGPDTKVVDLSGKMVLPGFHDSHVHPVTSGIELGQCNLHASRTVDELLETIRKYGDAHPEQKWITGGGWDLTIFPNANPQKHVLDKLFPDRPAYFESGDGHSGWANSAALRLAGIGKTTPDPVGGRIERNDKGESSGTLRESAMSLVADLRPKLSRQDYLDGLNRALAIANAYGITSLQEADADREEILDAYAELDRRGDLTARVVAALRVDPARGEEQVAELLRRRAKYHGNHLRADSVKFFMDGVIEADTASLLEPYLDKPDSRGMPNFTLDAMTRLVTRLDREGFQIHIHAIGDAGIRTSLDACEAAQKINGRRDARHHIAHLELIDPADIPRFAKLGIIANFQALWASAGADIRDLTWPKLGEKRSRWLYPIGSVLKTGAVVVGGSDWSVSSINPLDAIQVAVTRRGLTEGPGPAWLPEELADLASMIAAYTINGAYVSHQENETGSIEVGKSADLVVLDRNLFSIPPEKIHETKVLLTLVEGKQVFARQ